MTTSDALNMATFHIGLLGIFNETISTADVTFILIFMDGDGKRNDSGQRTVAALNRRITRTL